MTPELLMILNDAKSEIARLRQRNNIMQARLDMFDQMMELFNAYPKSQSVGMKPDIVWEIEKYQERDKNNKDNQTAKDIS